MKQWQLMATCTFGASTKTSFKHVTNLELKLWRCRFRRIIVTKKITCYCYAISLKKCYFLWLWKNLAIQLSCSIRYWHLGKAKRNGSSKCLFLHWSGSYSISNCRKELPSIFYSPQANAILDIKIYFTLSYHTWFIFLWSFCILSNTIYVGAPEIKTFPLNLKQRNQ